MVNLVRGYNQVKDVGRNMAAKKAENSRNSVFFFREIRTEVGVSLELTAESRDNFPLTTNYKW